jgi:hypothetical protein
MLYLDEHIDGGGPLPECANMSFDIGASRNPDRSSAASTYIGGRPEKRRLGAVACCLTISSASRLVTNKTPSLYIRPSNQTLCLKHVETSTVKAIFMRTRQLGARSPGVRTNLAASEATTTKKTSVCPVCPSLLRWTP